MSNLTKAIIQVTDEEISLGVVLRRSIQELRGKQIEVVLSKRSVIDAVDNPELRKYCLEYREDIIILNSHEFTIIMEVPYNE